MSTFETELARYFEDLANVRDLTYTEEIGGYLAKSGVDNVELGDLLTRVIDAVYCKIYCEKEGVKITPSDIERSMDDLSQFASSIGRKPFRDLILANGVSSSDLENFTLFLNSMHETLCVRSFIPGQDEGDQQK